MSSASGAVESRILAPTIRSLQQLIRLCLSVPEKILASKGRCVSWQQGHSPPHHLNFLLSHSYANILPTHKTLGNPSLKFLRHPPQWRRFPTVKPNQNPPTINPTNRHHTDSTQIQNASSSTTFVKIRAHSWSKSSIVQVQCNFSAFSGSKKSSYLASSS